MNSHPARRLLPVNEAAAYLGISPKTLYSWIESRRIPFVAMGRRRLLDVRSLDKFITENTVEPRDRRN